MPRERAQPRRVCFVTGTRAEFGLMRTVLEAIRASKSLHLQIVATGMHLDASRGGSLAEIAKDGWRVDAVVDWPAGAAPAAATGGAVAAIADALDRLKSDVVLVVGDRVEALAGAVGGHLSGRIVAHVHGGDRALGQVDDALRHAITKLAHLHFPATVQSAARIGKLGEDRWRIHRVGSPGIDGIRRRAASAARVRREFPSLRPRQYALLVLHPADADESVEFERARLVLSATEAVGFDRIILIYPNNDPGSAGIVRCWEGRQGDDRLVIRRNVERSLFLGLLRDAAVIVGNSSSGIIEAASFRTPAIDIGPRQLGRERCEDVTNVPYGRGAVRSALERAWNHGRPRRGRSKNVYGGDGAGRKVAHVLANVRIDDRLRRKLISY